MSYRDRLAVGGRTSQADPHWEEKQRKRARKAARQDARSGIPGNPEQPRVPDFVLACIAELVKRVKVEWNAHVERATPHWSAIAVSTERIAEADERIPALMQWLADAPAPQPSHTKEDAYRLDQERQLRERRLKAVQKTRDDARAELRRAREGEDASFDTYWARRAGEEADARVLIREHYLAELLRNHHRRETLETSLESPVSDAFAEALRELDEAERSIRNSRRPSGP
ncbi:MAG TPA: hypothetical protein VFO16_21950 [Pseudonocardiaceae bacterium]|nr:hypothetical protein [Pseudonocardiaceae bacterium]